MAQLTWKEIRAQQTGGRSRHKKHHDQALESVCPEAQKRFNRLRLDGTCEEYFRFRLSNDKRLWGFLSGSVFMCCGGTRITRSTRLISRRGDPQRRPRRRKVGIGWYRVPELGCHHHQHPRGTAVMLRADPRRRAGCRCLCCTPPRSGSGRAIETSGSPGAEQTSISVPANESTWFCDSLTVAAIVPEHARSHECLLLPVRPKRQTHQMHPAGDRGAGHSRRSAVRCAPTGSRWLGPVRGRQGWRDVAHRPSLLTELQEGARCG